MTAPVNVDIAVTETRSIDLTATYSAAATNPQFPGPPNCLGQRIFGQGCAEYVFVQAAASIGQYQVVQITQAYLASPATISSITQRMLHGFIQNAITSGFYGWAAIRGNNVGVKTKLGSLARANLYVSGTSPGRLTSTSVRTSALLTGVFLTSSATSASISSNVSGPMSAVASWPRPIA